MAGKVPEVVAATGRDLLALLRIPGGSLATAALRDFEERREEEARRLLFEALEAGEKTIADALVQDQLFAIWLRFRHAAVTGVAREKLRLMARYINGQLERDRLSTDAFSQFAGMIEGLRIEELVYLVTLQQVEAGTPKEEGTRGDRKTAVEAEIKKRLIPKWCADENSLEAVALVL